MDDNFTITDLLQILRRRRHIIAVTVVCFIVLAAVVCVVSTRRYKAEGTLQVQKESSDMLGLSEMMGSAGGMDDACRPVYNDMIHHYMPNSQRLLFTDRQHGPLLNSYDGDVFIGKFLDDPYKKVASDKKNIIAY